MVALALLLAVPLALYIDDSLVEASEDEAFGLIAELIFFANNLDMFFLHAFRGFLKLCIIVMLIKIPGYFLRLLKYIVKYIDSERPRLDELAPGYAMILPRKGDDTYTRDVAAAYFACTAFIFCLSVSRDCIPASYEIGLPLSGLLTYGFLKHAILSSQVIKSYLPSSYTRTTKETDCRLRAANKLPTWWQRLWYRTTAHLVSEVDDSPHGWTADDQVLLYLLHPIFMPYARYIKANFGIDLTFMNLMVLYITFAVPIFYAYRLLKLKVLTASILRAYLPTSLKARVEAHERFRISYKLSQNEVQRWSSRAGGTMFTIDGLSGPATQKSDQYGPFVDVPLVEKLPPVFNPDDEVLVEGDWEVVTRAG